jgi:hypothetical protein
LVSVKNANTLVEEESDITDKTKPFDENTTEYERVVKDNDEDNSKYFNKPDQLTLNKEEVENYLAPANESNESDDTQGLIVHANGMVFRLYKKSYADRLKLNPFFSTKQEEYFHKYQNNALVNDANNQNSPDNKKLTLAAFNFVAICLFRTLMYFTNFVFENDENDENNNTKYRFEKKNSQQWTDHVCGSDECTHIDRHHNALIRNINKLQRLPYALKQLKTVDFDQVKHHLKYHTTPQELNAMYHTFLAHSDMDKQPVEQQQFKQVKQVKQAKQVKQQSNPILCDIIGYKSVNNLNNLIKEFGSPNFGNASD